MDVGAGTLATAPPIGSVEWLRWLWGFGVVRAAVAALVVAAGVVLSKFLVRLLGRPVARRFQRQSVAQTVLGLLRVSTVMAATLIAASMVGLGIGDIVLSVTVFSAVLGIVLAPIVGSVITGLFVLADNPYEIGDMIELEDGRRGFVDDITIRYTKILTLDNTFLVVPNAQMRERDVTNFSAEDERTRLSIPLLVTYEGDIDTARSLMERAARNCEGVIEGGPDIRIGSARYPAKPTCMIGDYADSGVRLVLRFWVRTPYKIPRIESTVREHIRENLDDVDVEIAYPHQHLLFDETSGRARVAVEDGSRPTPDRDDAPATRTAEAEGVADPNGSGSTPE
ncbi:mechanosensitive ion channel family protein [Haloplanus rallus]|jgi:small-conductance mechanosensitive channel|uniref:Mechanosensitive ion channel family protein n=1 Tax=Haloplanus rallus TaxID=1816183 RepID=A0A6B9FD43_9EURY|nr:MULTISPECIES: mechanosensitive ion channel family protein [Haloplanus]QGX94250.1 mechanosensitive ion channel family protein [Haloplanus rallus]